MIVLETASFIENLREFKKSKKKNTPKAGITSYSQILI